MWGLKEQSTLDEEQCEEKCEAQSSHSHVGVKHLQNATKQPIISFALRLHERRTSFNACCFTTTKQFPIKSLHNVTNKLIERPKEPTARFKLTKIHLQAVWVKSYWVRVTRITRTMNPRRTLHNRIFNSSSAVLTHLNKCN